MKFINELREGERVGEIYLCKQKQSAVTKNGKPYENLILQDKTGTIDAKIWDPNSQGINEFEVLDYIDVVGDVVRLFADQRETGAQGERRRIPGGRLSSGKQKQCR